MKYVYVILLVLFIPAIAGATSGTCSSHGGVNCSAGYDYADGSAVCNDGWRDSSEFFGDISSCKNSGCSDGQYTELVSESGVNDIISQINDLKSQVAEKTNTYNQAVLVEQSKPILSSIIAGRVAKLTNTYNQEVSSLNYQISTLQSQGTSALNSVKRECLSMGQETYYKLLSGATQAQITYQNRIAEEAQQERANQLTAIAEQQDRERAEANRQMEIQRQLILSQATNNTPPPPHQVIPAPQSESAKQETPKADIKEVPANPIRQEVKPSTTETIISTNTSQTSTVNAIKPTTTENKIVQPLKKTGFIKNVVNNIYIFFSKLKFW